MQETECTLACRNGGAHSRVYRVGSGVLLRRFDVALRVLLAYEFTEDIR